MFKKLFTRLRTSLTPKKVVVASAFLLALSGAVGAGLVVKQNMTASASSGRDCSHNSIDYVNMHGGCGAMSPGEWTADMKSNIPGDLQSSAALFGTTPDEYARFANTARYGMSYKNGTVYVDGQLVMTHSWSIGRYNKYKAWNFHGYYANYAQDVYLGNQIPVMVMFNAAGVPETVVMQPCGNLVSGTAVVPVYHCDALNMSPVSGKKDTYNFTTSETVGGNAIAGAVIYDFGDGTSYTAPNASTVVQHTYTKPGNYTARVTGYARVPGLQTVTFTGVQCTKQVTVVAPVYVCTGLVAKALDEEMQNFRFTVKFSYANGPIPRSADFTVDGQKTTNSVNKDETGSYYYDATFTDTAVHTVTAKVNFDLYEAPVSTTQPCVAKVTSKKTPMCAVPGKEQYPPNSPQCFEECKPGIPVGDTRCTECKPGIPTGDSRCTECKPGVPMGDKRCTPELPNTGMGNVAGLFAGTSALGAAGHRLFRRRQNR